MKTTLISVLSRSEHALRRPVVAASLLFAAILTGTGALSTFKLIMPLRLGYWTITTLTAAASLVAASRMQNRLLVHAWLRTLTSIMVAAVPTTIIAGAGAILFFPAPPSVQTLLNFYPAALVLNALLLALLRLTQQREVRVDATPASKRDDSVPPDVASKLPPRLARSRLVVVEAQDHYSRVVTRDGEALVYMRFGDALAALEHSDGTRVHRSWWVARSAIDKMKFASGRGELQLVDGKLVPVSRRFASEAKALARRSQA